MTYVDIKIDLMSVAGINCLNLRMLVASLKLIFDTLEIQKITHKSLVISPLTDLLLGPEAKTKRELCFWHQYEP